MEFKPTTLQHGAFSEVTARLILKSPNDERNAIAIHGRLPRGKQAIRSDRCLEKCESCVWSLGIWEVAV